MKNKFEIYARINDYYDIIQSETDKITRIKMSILDEGNHELNTEINDSESKVLEYNKRIDELKWVLDKI